MDLGPDPTDRDDVIQRYGRRLFVLAYHLTGDATEAEELSHECLVRGLLAPDFPSSDSEAGIFLHRGLISLWRERMEPQGSAAVLRIAGGAAGPEAGRTAGAETGRAAREHAGLWRALSRLDPVSRAVLVLRVAGGLEYETIGKVLDMAPDVVYGRLLQARGGLQDGERSIDPSLFETMNLFLDDRLPVDQRGDFETRLMTDAALRERVEFHRGLTLDLHEEAPSLPRAYIGRLRQRLDRAQETLALVDQAAQAAGWEPAAQLERPAPPSPKENRLSRWAAPVAGALVVLAIGVALGHWAARRRPAAPGPGPGDAGLSATPGATPDEATVEALRSLGYLAPAKGQVKKKAGTPAPAGSPGPPARVAPGAKKPVLGAPAAKKPALAAPGAKKSAPDSPAAKKPAAPAGRSGTAAAAAVAPPAASASPGASPSRTPRAEPSPVPAPSAAEGPATAAPSPAAPATVAPSPAASPAPEEAATPSTAPTSTPAPTPVPTPAATPAEAPHQGTAVTWRLMPVARPPETGREYQVIRTERDWAELFRGTDAPPPSIKFDADMVVLLRAGLANDPPVRLVVTAVRNTAGALLIECRSEQPPEAGNAAPATAGQAIVMPISDLPIRVVVR